MSDQPRVVFARIGWMKRYNGSEPGDERPVGGGEYNARGHGSELHNFKPIGGTLYGFFQTPARDPSHYGTLSLKRVEPSARGEYLDDVTVIFVAPPQEGRNPKEPWLIVGWYRNAKLLRVSQEDTTGQRMTVDANGNTEGGLCNVMAPAETAVLLPLFRRTHPVPRGAGGMGQANVRYIYDERGKLAMTDWMRDAIAYVQEYDAENLLTDPLAENTYRAQQELEASAGYETDPRIRKAVEKRAMDVVEGHYRAQQYAVEDTSKHKSFDFLCTKGGTALRVEVKGTRTDGSVLLFTRNEVKLARDPKTPVDLCVVHSIELHDGDRPPAKGGILVHYPHWNPNDHQIQPVQWECRLTKRLPD